MDEIQIFQIWLFNLLFCHVFSHALEYLSGICRVTRAGPNSQTALDIQAAVALGLSRNAVFSGRGPVRLWILQRNADFHRSWLDYHDFIQAAILVCVLPDGNNDPANLQSKKCDCVTETKIKTGYTKATNKGKERIKMSVLSVNKNNFSTVKESAKPVLLDFYADWCGPCRMVSPLVDEIAEENPEILVGKINVDQEPELAQAFGVASIPTLIVMKEGKIVNQSAGAKPKPQILAMLKR